MNKKYFAKYLMVKKKIKEGDKWSYKDFKMIPLTMGVGKQRISEQSNKKRQKVKLFLCSRDIQVGDEFIDNTFNQTHICSDIQERNYYWKNENSPTGYSCDDGYKIIREIPSEVTWITEGMEFDDLPFLKY